MNLYLEACVAGLASGGIYSLIAVGVTQTFKVTRVLNFAYAGYVMWGAYLYASLTTEHGVGAPLAAVISVLAVGAGGVAVEYLLLRLAAGASDANKLMMTFGVFIFLSALAIQLFTTKTMSATALFPGGGFTVFSVQVTWAQAASLGIAIVAIAGVEAMLRLTRTGLLTRASVQDHTMAAVVGVRQRQISLINAAISAMLAGLAGVLIAPIVPFTSGIFFGYLVAALAAVLLAGMNSLILAVAGGLLVGVLDAVAAAKFTSPGAPTAITFVFALLVVAIRRKWPSQLSRVSWAGGSARRHTAGNWKIASGVMIAGWVALLVAVLISATWAGVGALILMYAVAAYSLLPVVGWIGQVSLAQGGIMGISAYTVAAGMTYYHWPFLLSVCAGAAVSAVAGAVIGLITVRLPLVLTAVVTLMFSALVTDWLLYTNFFHNQSGQVTVVAPGWLVGSSQGTFLIFAVVTLAVLGVLWSLKRSSYGARFMSLRSSKTMAAHFGVRPGSTHVLAFTLSGGIAGLAGAMYIVSVQIASPDAFGPELSFSVLLFTVLGGVTVLYGPLIGAIGFIGIPQLLGFANYGAAQWPQLLSGAATVDLMARRSDGIATFTRRPPRSGAPAGRPPSERNRKQAARRPAAAAAASGTRGAGALTPGAQLGEGGGTGAC